MSMMGYASMPYGGGGAPASDKKKQALPAPLAHAMLVEAAYSHSYPAEVLTEGVDEATDTVAAPAEAPHRPAKAKTAKAKAEREQQDDPAAPSEPVPEPKVTDGQPSVTDAPAVEEPKTAPGS